MAVAVMRGILAGPGKGRKGVAIRHAGRNLICVFPGKGCFMDEIAPISRRSPVDIVKGGAPIVCLTAYTADVARLIDPHVDLILVGDSLGMVLYGFPNT